MASDFWRCPACGKFCRPDAFKRGAEGEHALETGRPQGPNRPWRRQPMTTRMRRALAELLRQAAGRMEEGLGDGASRNETTRDRKV